MVDMPKPGSSFDPDKPYRPDQPGQPTPFYNPPPPEPRPNPGKQQPAPVNPLTTSPSPKPAPQPTPNNTTRPTIDNVLFGNLAGPAQPNNTGRNTPPPNDNVLNVLVPGANLPPKPKPGGTSTLPFNVLSDKPKAATPPVSFGDAYTQLQGVQPPKTTKPPVSFGDAFTQMLGVQTPKPTIPKSDTRPPVSFGDGYTQLLGVQQPKAGPLPYSNAPIPPGKPALPIPTHFLGDPPGKPADGGFGTLMDLWGGKVDARPIQPGGVEDRTALQFDPKYHVPNSTVRLPSGGLVQNEETVEGNVTATRQIITMPGQPPIITTSFSAHHDDPFQGYGTSYDFKVDATGRPLYVDINDSSSIKRIYFHADGSRTFVPTDSKLNEFTLVPTVGDMQNAASAAATAGIYEGARMGIGAGQYAAPSWSSWVDDIKFGDLKTGLSRLGPAVSLLAAAAAIEGDINGKMDPEVAVYSELGGAVVGYGAGSLAGVGASALTGMLAGTEVPIVGNAVGLVVGTVVGGIVAYGTTKGLQYEMLGPTADQRFLLPDDPAALKSLQERLNQEHPDWASGDIPRPFVGSFGGGATYPQDYTDWLQKQGAVAEKLERVSPKKRAAGGEVASGGPSTDLNDPLLQSINRDMRLLKKLGLPANAIGPEGVSPNPESGRGTVDRSLSVHISTPDLDAAFQKAKLWEQQRAMVYTGS